MRAWNAATSGQDDPRSVYGRFSLIRAALRGEAIESDDGSDPEVARRNFDRLVKWKREAQERLQTTE